MQSNQARASAWRGKPAAICAALGIAVLLCAVFPPIRFHRYSPGPSEGSAKSSISAAEFWDEQLIPATSKAADVKAVIAAIRANPATAKAQFAQTGAIGGPSYYFIKGSGRVVSQDAIAIGVCLSDATSPDEKPDILIRTSLVFGNAVRDATGLLNPNQFPNSADYNALSGELNKLVAIRVLQAIRGRTMVGAQIRFSGVAEIGEDETNPLPLQIIPLLVEFR